MDKKRKIVCLLAGITPTFLTHTTFTITNITYLLRSVASNLPVCYLYKYKYNIIFGHKQINLNFYGIREQ